MHATRSLSLEQCDMAVEFASLPAQINGVTEANAEPQRWNRCCKQSERSVGHTVLVNEVVVTHAHIPALRSHALMSGVRNGIYK